MISKNKSVIPANVELVRGDHPSVLEISALQLNSKEAINNRNHLTSWNKISSYLNLNFKNKPEDYLYL
jgi:hypothetical protein